MQKLLFTLLIFNTPLLEANPVSLFASNQSAANRQILTAQTDPKAACSNNIARVVDYAEIRANNESTLAGNTMASALKNTLENRIAYAKDQMQQQVDLCVHAGEGTVEDVLDKAHVQAVKTGKVEAALLLTQEHAATKRNFYHNFCVKNPGWSKLVGVVLACCGIVAGLVVTE